MGQTAIWHNADGDVQAEVLYRDPNKIYKLGGVDYTPENYSIEYKKGTAFDTLVETVRNRTSVEEITVNGERFGVAMGGSEWDGKTFRCKLELK